MAEHHLPPKAARGTAACSEDVCLRAARRARSRAPRRGCRAPANAAAPARQALPAPTVPAAPGRNAAPGSPRRATAPSPRRRPPTTCSSRRSAGHRRRRRATTRTRRRRFVEQSVGRAGEIRRHDAERPQVALPHLGEGEVRERVRAAGLRAVTASRYRRMNSIASGPATGPCPGTTVSGSSPRAGPGCPATRRVAVAHPAVIADDDEIGGEEDPSSAGARGRVAERVPAAVGHRLRVRSFPRRSRSSLNVSSGRPQLERLELRPRELGERRAGELLERPRLQRGEARDGSLAHQLGGSRRRDTTRRVEGAGSVDVVAVPVAEHDGAHRPESFGRAPAARGRRRARRACRRRASRRRGRRSRRCRPRPRPPRRSPRRRRRATRSISRLTRSCARGRAARGGA